MNDFVCEHLELINYLSKFKNLNTLEYDKHRITIIHRKVGQADKGTQRTPFRSDIYESPEREF